MQIKFTLLKARVPVQAVYVHIKSKSRSPWELMYKGQGQGQRFVFIRESDNLPDTGTLRSTCYEFILRKCKPIARNSDSLLSTAYNQINVL